MPTPSKYPRKTWSKVLKSWDKTRLKHHHFILGGSGRGQPTWAWPPFTGSTLRKRTNKAPRCTKAMPKHRKEMVLTIKGVGVRGLLWMSPSTISTLWGLTLLRRSILSERFDGRNGERRLLFYINQLHKDLENTFETNYKGTESHHISFLVNPWFSVSICGYTLFTRELI